jgi:hypothetical protein
MAKRGTYLGGSTVIKSKAWFKGKKQTRVDRVGLLAGGLENPSEFVGRTYVVRADDHQARAKLGSPARDDIDPKKHKPKRRVRRRKAIHAARLNKLEKD